jgi:hypothetical protein
VAKLPVISYRRLVLEKLDSGENYIKAKLISTGEEGKKTKILHEPSQQHINTTYFTCTLRKKKKNNFNDEEESNHKKIVALQGLTTDN